MDDIRVIVNKAVKATVQELQLKCLLISFEKTAFERTLDDVQNFKKALELLADEQVPDDFKKRVARHSMSMQRVLKLLKSNVSDQDFMMFYQCNFNGQTYRSLSVRYEVDERTVRTAVNRCMNKLSIFLHPDLFINEILN